MGYIERNILLAMDVIIFIDLLKLNLQSKLKTDLMSLDNTECYNVVHESDNGHSLVRELGREQSGVQSVTCELLK